MNAHKILIMQLINDDLRACLIQKIALKHKIVSDMWGRQESKQHVVQKSQSLLIKRDWNIDKSYFN